jgi:hypothetical protein
MKFLTRLMVLAAVFLFIAGGLIGQTVSEKKDIAVFNLSHHDWSITQAALGSIDDQIRAVFINIGRFNVIGLEQRLGANDVTDFVEKIKDYKSRNMEIPERVLMGQEAFTERDWNRLVGAFLVVIPSVSFYNLESLRDGTYKARIKTSFTIVNVDEGRSSAQFFVETTGQDRNANNAVQAAVSGIPGMLTFEIRKVPEFQVKSGIVQIMGRDIIFELGRNMGIMVGDEYAIMGYRNIAGFQAADERGLLIVKEVQEKFTVAQLIYSAAKPQVGDQLQEIPRIGIEGMIYGGAFLVDNYDISFIPMVGLKAVLARGFFLTRPVLGIEIPLSIATAALAVFDIVPMNVFIGAELTNLYLGRLQIAPTVVVGVGGAYLGENARAFFGTDQEYFMTHVGGKAFISTSILVSRNAKFTVDAGYAAWLGLADVLIDFDDNSYFDTKVGPFVNVGVTFK